MIPYFSVRVVQELLLDVDANLELLGAVLGVLEGDWDLHDLRARSNLSRLNGFMIFQTFSSFEYFREKIFVFELSVREPSALTICPLQGYQVSKSGLLQPGRKIITNYYNQEK